MVSSLNVKNRSVKKFHVIYNIILYIRSFFFLNNAIQNNIIDIISAVRLK